MDPLHFPLLLYLSKAQLEKVHQQFQDEPPTVSQVRARLRLATFLRALADHLAPEHQTREPEMVGRSP